MGESRANNLPWNENTVYAIGVYALIGRNLGIWPLQCDNIAARVRFLVVVTLHIILNYSLIQEFVNGCISTAYAVDFIGIFGSTTASLVKICVIRMHRKEMNCLIESAISDWSVSRDERSFEIMRKYAYFGRIVSIFQLSSAYTTAVVTIVSAPPTFGETTNEILIGTNSSTAAMRNIPLGSGCSVVGMSIFLYLAFYVLQFIQLLILVTSFIGCDAFFLGITMHLCGQFELLKIDITQLGVHPDQSNVKGELAALIDRHNDLAYHGNLVEEVFHLMILAQLTTSTLHIGLLGIEMLFGLQNGDYIGFLYSCITISVLILQIYLYSYAGECLTSQVKKIRDAAYNCWWYNFSPRLARDVMFIITGTNRPFYLTAGKIYPMNNHSFTSFINTMATFFSVLKLTILG